LRNLELIATQGLFRQEKQYNIIANNLSNMDTIGYKKDVPIFWRIMAESSNKYSNSVTETSATLFAQGDLKRTGNSLDLGIEGEGFFKIQTPGGVRYTRSGSFQLNREGILVQSNGFPVLGQGGEISLEAGSIVIGTDGSIQVNGTDRGKIALVTFEDLTSLKKEGQTLFKMEEDQGEKEATNGKILQGSLEMSNVDSMTTMVQLIESFQNFEACHRVVQANDEMDGKAVNELGKL
jgi:flagellar basal-body rod protein FlgF